MRKGLKVSASRITYKLGIVAHALNFSTRGRDRWISLSSRPASPTLWVPRQPEKHSETLSFKKQKIHTYSEPFHLKKLDIFCLEVSTVRHLSSCLWVGQNCLPLTTFISKKCLVQWCSPNICWMDLIRLLLLDISLWDFSKFHFFGLWFGILFRVSCLGWWFFLLLIVTTFVFTKICYSLRKINFSVLKFMCTHSRDFKG